MNRLAQLVVHAVTRRAGLVMAAAIVVWGFASLLYGERVPRAGGFGWDGTAHRQMALKFPETMPEISVYTGRRIIPSFVVQTALRVCRATPSDENLLLAFGAVHIGVFAGILAALMASARTLGIGVKGRWFLFAGYFLTYPHLKQYHYACVQTDVWATLLASLLLLAYVRRWHAAVWIFGMLAAFVWPTLPYLAAFLFLFPARRPETDPPIGEGGRWLGRLAAAAVAALLAWFLHRVIRVDQYPGHQPMQMIESVLPYSIALAIGYLFFALAPLTVPNRIVTLRAPYLGSAVRFLLRLGCVVLGYQLVAQAEARLQPIFPGEYPFPGTLAFLRAIVYQAVSKPLLSFVAHVCWFGPILAVAVWNWNRVGLEIRRAGLGLTIYLCAGIVLSLGGESRQLLTFFPAIALYTALVVHHQRWENWRVVAFGLLAVASSRFWLPLNVGPWPEEDLIYEYPMQRMFMNCGYPTTESYLIQCALCAALLVATAFIIPWRRRDTSVADASGSASG